MQTMELFDARDLFIPIETRIEKAHLAIIRQFEKGWYAVVAFSGGRDSSVTASLVLNAAREYVAKGGKVDILITNSDTLIESPEIRRLVSREMRKMHQYARKHGFEIKSKIVKPSLSSTWQLKLLSGRGIPSYAGTSTDCSVDLKITPQRSFRNSFFKSLAEKGRQAFTALGTRFSESEKRALKMALRGEREDIPVLNKDDEWILSPIARWSNDDVTEYMGMASNNIIEAYSDFTDTLRIYAHSAGTTCSVVADAIHEGAKRKKGGCGNRLGCYMCLQSEDKSLKAMVEFSDDYAYARPLVKLNNYLRATRYDWSKRHWVGRTIQAGYIAIAPDTFHPAYIRDLTRMMLQIDYDERVRARRKGEDPMFQILTLDMVIALDAIQSLNGVARPFQIWKDYNDITKGDVRYEVPVIDPVPETPMPTTKFLHVGKDWDDSSEWGMNGLRDAYWEAMTADSPCAPKLEPLGNGEMGWAVETEQQFSIDLESASMILDFEMGSMLRTYEQGLPPSGITYAYKWYLNYGVLSLSHSQRNKHAEILRRTAYKDRLGLTLDYNIEDLYERAIPFSQLPDDARKAWGDKATTDSAQVELDLTSLLVA